MLWLGMQGVFCASCTMNQTHDACGVFVIFGLWSLDSLYRVQYIGMYTFVFCVVSCGHRWNCVSISLSVSIHVCIQATLCVSRLPTPGSRGLGLYNQVVGTYILYTSTSSTKRCRHSRHRDARQLPSRRLNRHQINPKRGGFPVRKCTTQRISPSHHRASLACYCLCT